MAERPDSLEELRKELRQVVERLDQLVGTDDPRSSVPLLQRLKTIEQRLGPGLTLPDLRDRLDETASQVQKAQEQADATQAKIDDVAGRMESLQLRLSSLYQQVFQTKSTSKRANFDDWSDRCERLARTIRDGEEVSSGVPDSTTRSLRKVEIQTYQERSKRRRELLIVALRYAQALTEAPLDDIRAHRKAGAEWRTKVTEANNVDVETSRAPADLRSTVVGRFWSARRMKSQVSTLTASEKRENA